MIRKPLTYNKRKNKGLLFFSASSVGDTKQLIDFGVREILVSYFYIKKSLGYYDTTLKFLYEEDGIFMTDSGAFSFMGSELTDEMQTEEYWLPYLKEYVAWLRAHKEYIFVAANLDLDTVVGHDVVRKWNKEYFEPLEKEGLSIVYVAHEDYSIGDTHAVQHFREYCSKYSYVGVNQKHKSHASHFYQLAKQYNVRVHGFAWTELGIVKHFPFASLDSTTWLGGVRYGTTYLYDGKNFKTVDYKHKYRRKANRIKFERAGVDYSGVTAREDRVEINKMNLLGWMGFREEYLKMANLKLHTKTINNYEREHRKKD